MKLVMKTLWLLLMKKRNIEHLKKASEWWIFKEVMLKKMIWLNKAKWSINEVIKRNEIVNNRLKQLIHIRIKMKSYCLKCRKNTENINPRLYLLIMSRTSFHTL